MALKNKLFRKSNSKREWWLIDGVGRRYAPNGLAGPLIHTPQFPRR
jgi:hypothetical protein